MKELPKTIYPLFRSGLLAFQKGDLISAADYFEEVLLHAPEDSDTWVNLGAIALQQNQKQWAVHYFTQALLYDEQHLEARHNLAATFIHFDRFENALTHYQILLKERPSNIEYQYNAGVCEMNLGHLLKAIQHFEYVLQQIPSHFESLMNLAAIKNKQNQTQAAFILLQKAHAIQPHHEVCHFMLTALSNDQKNALTCFSYVRSLFDQYALQYDQHMMGFLKNQLPTHVQSELYKRFSTSLKASRALDLGCGTGVYGEMLASMSDYIVGVDLSEKMIAQAHKKAHYHELHVQELLDFLNQDTERKYDLIIAMDVFSYIGDLEFYIKAIQKKLSPQGLFIFSTEINQNHPWELQKTARFSHQDVYIKNLLIQEGLSLTSCIKVIAREEESPLEAYLFICSLTYKT